MDYDDNDFQSQNLQLAGEGSKKFPPVLRPYALSKFDFEDSLHSHLRFDSLVETEVFLGIETNEDNQWIEDFSRASSEIGFNTTAAESCSIPRRNNVWSEATSSESVEMLLKSVGQDDIVPSQTVTRESDASDELGCIIKQMEPSLKHEHGSPSKVEDVTGLNPTLPAKIPEASSGLKDDVGAGKPQIEDASKTEAGNSVDGGLNGPSTGNENANTAVIKGSKPVAGEHVAIHQKEVRTFADESLDVRRKEESFGSSQVVTTVSSLQNTSVAFDNQDGMHLKNDVGDKETDGLEKDFKSGEKFHERQGIQIDHQNLDEHLVAMDTSHIDNSSASEMEFNEDGHMIKTSAIVDPSTTVLKEDSDFHMVEGCGEAVLLSIPAQLSQSGDLLLSKNSVIGDHSIGKLQDAAPMSSGDVTGLKGHDGEISKNNIGISTNLESKIDSMVQIICNQSSIQENEQLLESSGQLDKKGLTGKSEECLLSLEDDKVSKGEGDGSSKSYEGDISGLNVVCSSVTLSMTQTRTTFESVHDTSGACGAESAKISEENIVSSNTDAYRCDQGPFVHAMQCMELPIDHGNTDCGGGGSLLIDKEVCSPSFDGGNIGNSLVSKLQSNAVSVNDSDGVPLPSAEGVLTDAVDKQEVQVSFVPVVLPPDEEGSLNPTISLKASLSNLKSPEERTESHPIPESGDAAPCDAGDEFTCKPVDKSLPMVDASSSASQTDLQAVLHPAVTQECSKEMEISTNFCVSIVSESGRDEVKVISEKLEEGNNEGDRGSASSKVTDSELIQTNKEMLNNQVPLSNDTGQDGGKDEVVSISGDKGSSQIAIASADMETGCSSPIVIRTSEPSHSEAEKERVIGSTDQNGLAFKVVDGVSMDPKGNANDVSAGDGSFTFEVPPIAELSGKETGKNWQPFPSTLSSVERSPTSTISQVDIKTAQDASHENLKVSDKEIVHRARGSKGSSERKTRRTSSKSAGKETAKKATPVKETTPSRQSQRFDRTGNASLSSSGICQPSHSNEISHYRHIEGSNIKPFGVLSSSVSSLPDLNTAASSSALFNQPFTDLQQVQLRAQIFVYGALIQGIAPDEAYMISAFGGPDGGRSLWEKNWRACIERLHGQKSHPINPETPLQSQLGAKTDQAIKQNLQNKVTSSPASRATSKSTPMTTVSPMMPLSSPLWSVPTPSCDSVQSTGVPRGTVIDYQPVLSPLHPHQTPPIRNFVNAPWVSQSPFRAPWFPQTAAFDTSARFPVLPITEPVSLTPARESSGPHSSGGKQVSPVPVVQSGSHANVLAGTPLLDPKKAIVAPGQQFAEPKSRRRKKIPVPEEPGQVILKSQSQTATHSVPVSTSIVCEAVAITTPKTIASKSTTENFIMPVSPIITPIHLQKVDRGVRQKVNLSEETHSKLKESQVQAMDAAALAVAAISHSQEIWNELNKHKNARFAVDIETKLTSAAVAIATAAAVAKAAAAAANVASNAALQAKLMADEALVSIGSRNSVQTNAISSDSVKNLGQATSASILNAEGATNSSNSIIVAAREAARRRVEAASAASKHAENMAAVVKAAELAAEAVSQAGTIVAMGEPFSLSELVEAGPEAYWRVQKVSSEQVMKSNDVNREQLSRGGHEGQGASGAHSKEVSLEKETQSADHGTSLSLRNSCRKSIDHNKLMDGFSGSSATSGKEKKGQKARRAPDLAKTMGAVLETENSLRSSSITAQTEYEKEVETLKEMNIGEGSLVEVLRVGGGSKVAWFLASVQSLSDGKACVCYHELRSDDGDKLKEWVELKGEGENAPRIRAARPITAMPFEGTRKRRRAAMGDYNWAIGDRVDAWMQDSWREGVITEKNKKDETSLTVQFTAQRETSVVKAWHLRPSQIWKDGNWFEWSSSVDNNFSTHEGDSPQEKRPRLGSPCVGAKGKDKVSKGTDIGESGNPDDTRLLDLAASDRIFNIGKNTRDDSKTDSLRMIRTGLQKEGSRVVFGIPKPGKKRKFMEVSKHYVSDQSKKNVETNDSVKFAKYLMPQGSGPRVTKSNPKSDPKEKQMAVSKPKVPKSGKPPFVSSRTISKKDNFSNASISETDDDDATDVSKSKDSASHNENASGKRNMMEFRSFSSSEGAAEGPILFSSAGLSSDAPASKKTYTSNAKSERMSKGKLPPAAGKLAQIEEDKASNGNSTKPTSEVTEPRRSNRRIQPTSRLLEGLQSSLIISKIPSVSHDKGHRTQNRNAKRE